jgi:DNA-binding transcriptional LysR family regulator
VSQHLAALARQTGTQLVEQHGRRLQLTTAGEALVEHAENILAELERAEQTLGALSDGQVGVVHVGAFQTAINGLIIPAMRSLREQRPGLRVRVQDLNGDSSIEALLSRDIDVAIWLAYPGSRAVEERGAVSVPVMEDVLDVVLPADHPRAGARAIRLEHLKHDVWVAGIPSSPCRRITDAACAAAGFSPRVEHFSDDWATVVGLVAAGAGVALVPRLAQPRPTEDIVIRPVSGPSPRRHVKVVTRSSAVRAPYVQLVVNEILRVSTELAAAS